jgi:hypothetical protein
MLTTREPASRPAGPSLAAISRAATFAGSALRRDALVLAWYLLVSLFAALPILPDPRNLILGELGDNIHYVYMAGWSAQSLLIGESPFIDPRLNYPDDLSLASNDSPYLSYLLVAPATLALGPVFGYNLAVILCHLLSGYFTYLWARRLTGSPMAAVFAGTAFLLTPFRIFRSLGHANMLATQAIPLFFWALDRTVRPKDTRELNLWLLGLATLFVAGSSQYLLVISLVTGAIYTLSFTLPDVRFLVERGWRIAASVLLGGLIGSLPYVSVLGSGAFEPFNIGRTRLWSADPANFFLPSSMHPLWGQLVNSVRPEPYAGEKTLYLGMATLAVALVGAYHLYRQPGERRRLLVWALTAASAAVFALGTDLWINNEPLSRDSPIWLPAYYLGQLPLVSIMRVWSRFGIITIFFVAMLSAYGVVRLLQRARGGRAGLAVGAALMLLLLIDLLPGRLPAAALQPRPIERWLAAQEGDFAVAFLPVDKPLINDLAIFGSLFHGKQMPAYIHAAHLPRAYEDFAAIAGDFPSERSVEYLRWRGLRLLILDKGQYNGWRAPEWSAVESQLAQFPQLSPVAEDESFLVLALEPGP